MSKAANGRSSIYRADDGWHGWVSFPAGRRRHVRAQTKREVAAKVADLEASRSGGLTGGPSMTLGEWITAWIDLQSTSGVRRKTVEGYRTDQRHIDRIIGQVVLEKLSVRDIDRLWTGILAAGAGPPTCAHARRTLSAAINAARDRGYVSRNVVRLSAPPRYEPVEVEPLSEAEARKVLRVAAGLRNGARWDVCLALGLRQGEVLGLRWSDVDLETGMVHIRHQLQHPPWVHGCNPHGLDPVCTNREGRSMRPDRCPQRRDGGPVLVEVKSAAGKRQIALPNQMQLALRRHASAQAAERLAAGDRWHDWGLIFPGPTGEPMRKEMDSRLWHRLLLDAGVPDRRLHDGRHTAATLMMAMGVPPATAMALLGHSDPRVSSRYVHLMDTSRRQAADQMGRALWG